MKIFVLSFMLLFSALKAGAQSAYIDTDYKYTYIIKFQEIKSPGSAKIAKKDFTDLFDSQLQIFSSQDTCISIRSSITISDSVLINKLNEYGYTILSFSKSIIIQNRKYSKKRE
ncbi:MAG: hypothetical protein IPH89_09940 [Bacteroidetes bacterium]|nr:hypothetical protein [Bacteroidota bacterium]